MSAADLRDEFGPDKWEPLDDGPEPERDEFARDDDADECPECLRTSSPEELGEFGGLCEDCATAIYGDGE